MHPDYELQMVCLRAGVHALGRLTPAPAREQRAVSRLEQVLDRMDSTHTRLVTGRHMVWKALCAEVAAEYRGQGAQ
eukprot:10968824-Lingulodinium_polyedra.AAC.1